VRKIILNFPYIDESETMLNRNVIIANYKD